MNLNPTDIDIDLESEYNNIITPQKQEILTSNDINNKLDHLLYNTDSKNIQNIKNRQRHNEIEEDQEIVADEIKDDINIIRLTKQPSIIIGEMREYQVEALNWLIKLHDTKISGILADEMGLGKTLEAISILGYLKQYRNISGPHLIIAPKSTINNWYREVNRWCPSLRPFQFHGGKLERPPLVEKLLDAKEWDICITTYEMGVIEKSAIKKVPWSYLIIDEAHRIKNENSLLSQMVRLFKSTNRLLITGTPLQNNLHELWALLNFLLPDLFSSASEFETTFNINDNNERDEIIKKLHKVLRPFLLRRLKVDVEKSLPPKKEIKLYVGLSDLQKTWYKNLLAKDIDVINSVSGPRVRLLNLVMQLRKVCNHPYLFQGAEPGPPFVEGQHMIDSCGKMILLDKLLQRLRQRGSRVLIFSQMTRMLDILEDYCIFRKHQYCRIDGSTDQAVREEQMDTFNAPSSKKFIFLLSTRAGGLGINLQTADTVILYDSDWNPQMDLQAQDRAHRIGQKKPVFVYRFVSENSVEQKMIERADKKLFLDAIVIQQGRLQEQHQNATAQELLSMVRFGAEEIFRSGNNSAQISDMDIDAILAQGENRTAELMEKMKVNQNSFNLANFTLQEEATSIYDFHGVAKPVIVNSEFNFIEPPKRERKQTYDVNEYYRNTLNTGGGRKADTGPKIYKPVSRPDHQFFDNERLEELGRKEWEAKNKVRELLRQIKQNASAEKTDQAFKRRKAQIESLLKSGKSIKEAELEADEVVEESLSSNDDSEDEKDDAPSSIDKDAKIAKIWSTTCTNKDLAEKEKLESEGFSEWSKVDFLNLCKALQTHGRKAKELVQNSVEGKTPAEVRQYLAAFWERGPTEIRDWDRIISNIEKGEVRLEKLAYAEAILNWKIEQYNDPWLELEFESPKNPSKYVEEEDRFLICSMHECGYSQWEEVKLKVRVNPWFKFNWFIKSRTAAEIGRRCESLYKLIEKEYIEAEALRVEELKKKRAQQRAAERKAAGLASPARTPTKAKTPTKPASKSSNKSASNTKNTKVNGKRKHEEQVVATKKKVSKRK